jgi:hypothetical protein
MAVIKGGFEIVKRAMLKELMKRGDDGIMLTLPKNEIVDLNTRITMDRLIKAGIDPESLTSPDQVLNVLENINNQIMKNARVISADSAEGKTITDKLFGKKGDVVDMTGKKMDTSQGIMGGKSVKELMESGQVQKGTDDIKISEKITDRDMFKNSNLNKQGFIKQGDEITSENFGTSQFAPGNYSRTTLVRDTVIDTVKYIKSLKPMDAMKEANSVIGRKGKYKDLTPEQSKKILQDTEDHIFERDIPIDPEDMAKGGRAGLYTGGMVDVEPNLSDIGHGSDALMARTRLVSPDGQATTSTGLNYLLAEDNDNIRVPFAGGGMGRRAFLKLLASIGGGVAAAKSGILGLGKGGGKQITKEVAKEVATGSGTVPPYFLNLVKKIKNLGDDAPRLATKDREKVTTYKDYTLTEDVTTGEKTIQRMKVTDDGSEAYYGQPLTEETYMSYKPGQADELTKGKTPPDEYEEGTAYLRSDRGNAGEIVDESFEISDDVIEEGTMFEDNLSDFGKAEGGRIGYGIGGLSKLGITGSSRRFLEKIFGKGSLDEMIKRDPEMHRGLLEVTEMFRKRDKEGLKAYMKNFLPHMDDTQIEEFIIGDAVDIAGQAKFGLGEMQGQLIRLGSGRDYKGKLEAIKKLEDAQKLDTLDVTEEMIRKPNAFGGIQTMLGE